VEAARREAGVTPQEGREFLQDQIHLEKGLHREIHRGEEGRIHPGEPHREAEEETDLVENHLPGSLIEIRARTGLLVGEIVKFEISVCFGILHRASISGQTRVPKEINAYFYMSLACPVGFRHRNRPQDRELLLHRPGIKNRAMVRKIKRIKGQGGDRNQRSKHLSL